MMQFIVIPSGFVAETLSDDSYRYLLRDAKVRDRVN
jgi:hypothetical protein